KKTVVVTSDPLALIVEKTSVSRSKEKVVVSSDSEGRSEADDFSELKKITALLAKAFNRRKFYSKPTNKNLRTSSTSQSANKKQEFVKTDNNRVEMKDDEKKRDMSKVKCYNFKKEGHFAKDYKKAKVKDYEYYKTKMMLAKKDKDEQVLLAEDQAWMESSSDSDQEINANMVFMAQIEKVLSDSEASSLSADEKFSENVEIKLKRKRRKRKSSKQNVKQVDNDVSSVNIDFVHFLDLDTFSSVRRPKSSSVVWKKKGSSNTSNVGLMNDLLYDNNFFIFDDVNVRISPVSMTPFRKKPRDSMHMRSKSNLNKSLPRTVHKWLPKMQPLAELVSKWFPRVKHCPDLSLNHRFEMFKAYDG
nr:hypothetical protein [Tanacetum cinerariifolium]